MARSKPKTPPLSGPNLLKKWRGKRTQASACALVGLDPATYNAFEMGRARPGLKRAARIESGTDGAVPIGAWVDTSTTARAA